MSYLENPKTAGSGILSCIPQKGTCPNNCVDCFFQSGRSYLSPLSENLPNIPSKEEAWGRVVRVNDGNDSNVQRELVERVVDAQEYMDYFFNTAIPNDLGGFSGPVVLTVNPGEMTDTDFHKVDPIPSNLMFVRVRVNWWNLDLVGRVIDFYTQGERPVDVILTWMAHYTQPIPDSYKEYYEYRKRTLNSYWCIKYSARKQIEDMLVDNSFVYSCGYKDSTLCKDCGNCLRAYYATQERLRNLNE